MNKKDLLSLGFEEKLEETKRLIKEWYEYYNGNVYVGFSGGKDSTVLLHIVRSMYPEVPAVFLNTGLEFPEIMKFVRSVDNVVMIRPKMPFKDVLKRYGYPIISKEQSQYIYQFRHAESEKTKELRWNGNKRGLGKISEKWKYLVTEFPWLKISHKCCDVLKKEPTRRYEKETGRKPMIGTMASESRIRKTQFHTQKINNFDTTRPMSKPIFFWNEGDIYKYVRDFDVKVSEIYKMGYKRTGCMFCMYGLHLEKGDNRFQRMRVTHPKLYDYCMNKLGLKLVIDIYLKWRLKNVRR